MGFRLSSFRVAGSRLLGLSGSGCEGVRTWGLGGEVFRLWGLQYIAST